MPHQIILISKRYYFSSLHLGIVAILLAFVVVNSVSAAPPTVPLQPRRQSICTVSASRSVNRRSGAGTGFKVVGQLTPEQPMTAVGQAKGTDGVVWWWLTDGSFVRSDLVTTSGNCSDLPTVPATPPVCAAMDATADKRQLTFISNDLVNGDIATDIFLLNVDGSGFTQLTDDPKFEGATTWSPDGRQLAFIHGDDIAVMCADGSNLRRLTRIPAVWDPKWSPDSAKIVFSVNNEAGDTFVMDITGKIIQTLTVPSLKRLYSEWSPAGDQIAFIHRSDPNVKIVDLYVINADGSNPHQLTTGMNINSARVKWSPDGRQIMFDSSGDKGSEVYVINADGSDLRQLTNNDIAYEGNGDWSPDGTQIAFISKGASGLGNTGIYVMNADGSNMHQVYEEIGTNIGYPLWSPDGKQIAFFSNYDFGNGQFVYVMDADGSNAVNLTALINIASPPGRTWRELAWRPNKSGK